MLYRLQPPGCLTWVDLSARDLEAAVKHGADLDRLTWQATEARVFSVDLLRIALRHGVASGTGIVLDPRHTVDLGRSDELRANQQAIDELQAEIRRKHGSYFEGLIPGWTASGEELDRRVRETSDKAAQEADDDLAEMLAAPVDPLLAEHWTRLGGTLPH